MSGENLGEIGIGDVTPLHEPSVGPGSFDAGAEFLGDKRLVQAWLQIRVRHLSPALSGSPP